MVVFVELEYFTLEKEQVNLLVLEKKELLTRSIQKNIIEPFGIFRKAFFIFIGEEI